MALLCDAFTVKKEIDDGIVSNKGGILGSDLMPAVVKSKVVDDDEFAADEVDHVPLTERMRMLLAARPCNSFSGVQTTKRALGLYAGTVSKQEARSLEEVSAGVSYCVVKDGHPIDSNCKGEHETIDCQNSGSTKFNEHETQAIDPTCLSQASHPDVQSPSEGLKQVDADAGNKLRHSSLSSLPIQVKVESMENMNALGIYKDADIQTITVKMEIFHEFHAYELDHIPLQQRIKMLVSGLDSNSDISKDLNCLQDGMPCTLDHPPIGFLNIKRTEGTVHRRKRKAVKDTMEKACVPCAPECDPIDSVHVKAISFSLRRKRKKTVTDSVETALEEDAPGLLQVLVERGIKVDEIKLYGDAEDEGALDMTSCEDDFAELETVISKIFSQPTTLLKIASQRRTKESKVSYCLACLVSLIEQTRYLQFRKWPVEWGWCRELQSFLFIFKSHNRIVLERPEYGYATYFFELVESLPIDWQIKRLVTAMKVTNCSRMTLLENKALLVGEDLTEGEARVLEEYGWKPNSGLGTMLHYCDRVVHDRRNEGDISEWRSKIGKLLVNGCDGGSVVLFNLPKKVAEYIGVQSPQIKSDL